MPSKLSEVLPEGPEREALIKQFGADAEIGVLAKGYIDTKAKLSSTKRVPEKDAATTDWDAFYATMGRPATASDYKLPAAPDNMKSVLEALRDPAWKKGLTQEQFESLAAEAATVANQANSKTADVRKSWEAKLREQLGEKADKRLQDADASLKNLLKDDPEAMRVIQESGLDKHPAVAKLLMTVRDKLKDDGAPLGSSPAGTVGPSDQELHQEALKITNSAEYKDTYHPSRPTLQARFTEIVAELGSRGYTSLTDPRLQPRPKIKLPDGRVIEVPNFGRGV